MAFYREQEAASRERMALRMVKGLPVPWPIAKARTRPGWRLVRAGCSAEPAEGSSPRLVGYALRSHGLPPPSVSESCLFQRLVSRCPSRRAKPQRLRLGRRTRSAQPKFPARRSAMRRRSVRPRSVFCRPIPPASTSSLDRLGSGRCPYFYRPSRRSLARSGFPSALPQAFPRALWRVSFRRYRPAPMLSAGRKRSSRRERRAGQSRATSRTWSAADDAELVRWSARLINEVKRFKEARIAVRKK